MASYTIELRSESGATIETLARCFAIDDDAIEFAGSLDHPHQMIVTQGARIVGSFSPVDRLRRWDKPSI